MSKSIIPQYVEFNNERHNYHSRKASELKSVNERSASFHLKTARKHEEIADWFTDYLEDPPVTRKSIDDLFSLNPLELDELDEDVLSELSISDSDINDAQILDLLDIANRPLDLNEIILGSLRKYKIKHKRPQLTARIHRLVNKNEIAVVGKGSYALPVETDNAGLEAFSDDEIQDALDALRNDTKKAP